MASKLNRPFAVFDIDGTVIRWQLYHAIGDALAQKGIIDKQAFEPVTKARMNWKRRSGKISFYDYEQTLVKVFEQTLKGLKADDLYQAAEAVYNEYKDQVYVYTRDLIRDLQAKNYLLFAISVSPDIIISKLANYYGFDDYAASHFQSRRGILTGDTELSLGKKASLLSDLILKHQASALGSIAVGDSEGDIDMLANVERPIAFNPSEQLLKHAMKSHWSVVVERKNVIYSLNFKNNEYILSK